MCFFTLYMICHTDVKFAFSRRKEVKAEVVEDPCKCEARLVFQKQTQAAIQQLTAKHILPVVSDGRHFIIYILCSTFHRGGSFLFLPAGSVIGM